MERTNRDLLVDGARLWDSLEQMGEIGGTAKGGCNRQTLTDLDRQGRDLFTAWCTAAGMSMAVDSMGSMFARREGAEPDLDPVAIGSHLDTQPTGGKYDGVLGVLAGLELVRTLNELGIRTRRPIEIVNWTNEEGGRFAPAMLASGVFAEVFREDWAKSVEDGNGAIFGEELRRIGFEGPEPVGARKFHAFYELHIEQGPILEAEGLKVGIVTHAQGLRWLDITVEGTESHAGTTPMPRRHDALLGAAELVQAVAELARGHSHEAVGTVGRLITAPNSRNIIPGRIELSADFRHPSQEGVDLMTERFKAKAEAVAETHGLTIAMEEVGAFQPVTFDPDCAARLRDAAEALGLGHRDMISGAGHDACYIARVAPTAMLFCPCVDGLSHNEEERIHPEWAEAAANVLLHAALEAAEVLP